jgi:hypothetical protein
MAKVADRIQANLNRILESIRDALKQNLESDEELRWFGSVTQLRAPAPVRFLLSWGVLLPIFGGLVMLALEKRWYVGITGKRVLFGRMKYQNKPDPNGVIAVQLGDITVSRRGQSGGDLIVANSKDGLPSKFRLPKGTDIDKVQVFLQA